MVNKKFEQHSVIEDSKFQKQKLSFKLYFDENNILNQKRALIKLKASFYKK